MAPVIPPPNLSMPMPVAEPTYASASAPRIPPDMAPRPGQHGQLVRTHSGRKESVSKQLRATGQY